MFINCGSLTVNVKHIALVRWAHAVNGDLCARVYFAGDPEPAEIIGQKASVLSDTLSALEADAEVTFPREYMPSLYRTDADNLDALQAALVFDGPDCSA